jgi:hypothetical protein
MLPMRHPATYRIAADRRLRGNAISSIIGDLMRRGISSENVLDVSACKCVCNESGAELLIEGSKGIKIGLDQGAIGSGRRQ